MNTLLNKSNPLLIHGKSGSGKSCLSMNLSDNMVVTKIDSSMLKNIKDKPITINKYNKILISSLK